MSSSSSFFSDSARGSLHQTSKAAPAMMPSLRAVYRSSSLTMPPRATLASLALGFIILNCGREIMFLVSGRSGVWMVMKSDVLRTSSRVVSLTPRASATSLGRNGSYPTMVMLKAFILLATSPPTRPTPMMPRTLPLSSTPVYLDLFHSPLCMDSWANGMFLAMARSIAQECSAAERMFAEGVFITSMPFSVAWGTSMLSTPTPARPMTLRLAPASMTLAFAFVPDLMIRAS